jgi:LuxR family maltose regulon positive regulatory protein
VKNQLIARRGLFGPLEQTGRVTVVSASAGAGKTSLARCWIAESGLSEQAAWVSVGREARDPQAFWLAVLDALRGTRAGSELVRELTAAPGLHGGTIVRRLAEDLSSLEEPLWLVIDDLHELKDEDAVRQLEELLAAAPASLRFVLLTRHDLRLGLHRLRLEGELTEIRGEDLRFTVDESRELLEAAGVLLSDEALESLVATTEGWAAGLRLAALSMTGHPDPESLAAGFSGRERTVAEYLFAEVLERQPEEVTRLLLRTSVLERVSGPLADRLTGGSGSERILMELEDASAFVVAVDPERMWFRYHHLFADLLGLELRRTAPEELPELHSAAAAWLAEHGYPVEAIRHVQAAENWGLAARLLADNWFALYLDGRQPTVRGLLARFPDSVMAADAELAVVAAGDMRAAGLLGEAERYLKLAASLEGSVSEERRARFRAQLVFVRLAVARARNDPEAVAEEAKRLLALAETRQSAEFEFREDLQLTALTYLAIAETWSGRHEDAEHKLDRVLAEARRIGRPWLELQALSHLAVTGIARSPAIGERRAREALELARVHGWDESAGVVVTASVLLARLLVWRARLQDAELWLNRAERVLGHFAEHTQAVMVYAVRALLEFARGRDAEAIAASRQAERMEGLLVTSPFLEMRARAINLQVLVALGEREWVAQALATMDEEARSAPEMRLVVARLRLANEDPEGAVEALAPVLDGLSHWGPWWEAQALLLEAIARDALGDLGASSRALERSLDLAEPDGVLLPFMLIPAPELLERHARIRGTHASLISEILNLRSGHTPAHHPEDPKPLDEPLTPSELRVLQYLPTNLQVPEIAAELFLSVNTVRTHIRHVFAKLGAHGRTDAVARARELGLLAASTRTRRGRAED